MPHYFNILLADFSKSVFHLSLLSSQDKLIFLLFSSSLHKASHWSLILWIGQTHMSSSSSEFLVLNRSPLGEAQHAWQGRMK